MKVSHRYMQSLISHVCGWESVIFLEQSSLVFYMRIHVLHTSIFFGSYLSHITHKGHLYLIRETDIPELTEIRPRPVETQRSTSLNRQPNISSWWNSQSWKVLTKRWELRNDNLCRKRWPSTLCSRSSEYLQLSKFDIFGEIQ